MRTLPAECHVLTAILHLPIVVTVRQDRFMSESERLAGSVATLTTNGAKARFGVAYLRAVCSHAGLGFAETSIDEDVLAIDGVINFALAEVRVQVKCTGQFRINGGGTATWPAEDAWWEKWHRCGVPAYFVLVVLDPDDQVAWLQHDDAGTLHRAAAFWVRVDNMSVGPGITVPKRQRLTADTLQEWAEDLEECFRPSRGGGLGGL